jgi:hypothetical protein
VTLGRQPWGGGRLIVIGGFAKAGSSALFETLSSHPSVCPSIEKEPYFFADEHNDAYQSMIRPVSHHRCGLEAYRSVFDTSLASRPVKLDGSGNYVYQQTALDIIPTLPATTLAVTVRRPALRVLSLFRWMRDQICLIPTDTDFAAFLATCDRAGFDGAAASVLNGAVDHSRYARHLAPWYEAMGDRLVVIRIDSGADAVRADLDELARLACLDDAPTELARANITQRMRSPRIARLAFAAGTSRNWGFKQSRTYGALRGGYLRLNGTGVRRPLSDCDAEVLIDLDERFASETDRLEALVRRDLSAWRQPLDVTAIN